VDPCVAIFFVVIKSRTDNTRNCTVAGLVPHEAFFWLQGNKSHHRFNQDLDWVNPYVTLNLMVGLNSSFNSCISQSYLLFLSMDSNINLCNIFMDLFHT
jgi:hypothetical protein